MLFCSFKLLISIFCLSTCSCSCRHCSFALSASTRNRWFSPTNFRTLRSISTTVASKSNITMPVYTTKSGAKIRFFLRLNKKSLPSCPPPSVPNGLTSFFNTHCCSVLPHHLVNTRRLKEKTAIAALSPFSMSPHLPCRLHFAAALLECIQPFRAFERCRRGVPLGYPCGAFSLSPKKDFPAIKKKCIFAS